jgi:hypothetical protein
MAEPATRHYRTLDPVEIRKTAATLSRRVAERFPGSGLSRVAADLEALAGDLATAAAEQRQPIWWPRILIALGVAAGLVVLGSASTIIRFDRISTGAFDFMQGIEASLNVLIIIGLGLLFLWGMEERIKRRRIFKELHGLRSLIHVIDMHQLTKDPAALHTGFTTTQHSPKRTMTPAELGRYLDYCSEMLSITGKLAALFAQSVDDAVVVNAVNDIETLGSNLSRKIWQKITLIDAAARRE